MTVKTHPKSQKEAPLSSKRALAQSITLRRKYPMLVSACKPLTRPTQSQDRSMPITRSIRWEHLHSLKRKNRRETWAYTIPIKCSRSLYWDHRNRKVANLGSYMRAQRHRRLSCRRNMLRFTSMIVYRSLKSRKSSGSNREHPAIITSLPTSTVKTVANPNYVSSWSIWTLKMPITNLEASISFKLSTQSSPTSTVSHRSQYLTYHHRRSGTASILTRTPVARVTLI